MSKKKIIFVGPADVYRFLQETVRDLYEIGLFSDCASLLHRLEVFDNIACLVVCWPPAGIEELVFLKSWGRSCIIPILVLVQSGSQEELGKIAQAGADDYLCAPWSVFELQIKLAMNVRRSLCERDVHPLTHLPGSTTLSRLVSERQADELALLYVDIDNFKAFNDYYGFAQGDSVLCAMASFLSAVLQGHGELTDIAGHVGGDDFMLLTTPGRAEQIAHALIASFQSALPSFYSPADFARGRIVIRDRRGVECAFPLMTLSIAQVDNQGRQLPPWAGIAQLLTELKLYAKSKPQGPGSNYVRDRRKA